MTLRTLEGVVHVGDVARGSKSEQRTVTLHTAERVWLLRRAGGKHHGVDRQLARLAGKRVRVTGHAGTGAFLAVAHEVLDD